jgi:hypothetical protein
MPTLYYTDYFNSELSQQRILVSLLNRELGLKQLDKKHPSLTLVDGEVVLHDANAISMYLGNQSKIFGENWEE